MTRIAILVPVLVLAMVAVLARPVALAQGRVDPSASADVRRDLAQARSEAARARERAAALDRQAQAALVASDRATLGAAALAARVQQAEAMLAASEADLADVVDRRSQLATRLAQEGAPVARLLAGLQTQVRRPAVLQLLQPGSITDAVHLRAVVVAVEPQIRSRTVRLRSELASARALERRAAKIAATRRSLQVDLVARRAELATLSAAEQLRARRAASAADREAERAYAIAANARDLSSLMRRLEAVRSQPFVSAARPAVSAKTLPADLTAPHRWPVQGRVAAAQSATRKGLTLETRPGAVVVAPGPGRVAFAGPYRGFGTIVILEHAGGWTTLLTGLAAAQVAVGQPVVAGSPLGQAAVRDPRVTVELRRNGTPVDPAAQLR